MFGGQSLGGGELLMGGGSSGSAAATALQQQQQQTAAQMNRSRSGSGSAGSGGSGTLGGPSQFDLSQDFPTLGGGGPGGAPGGPSAGTASAVGGAIGSNGGDSLAAALRQQQLYRIATAGQPNLNIAAEDFPALPGSGPGSGNAPTQGQRSGSNPSSSASSPFMGSAQAVSRGGGGVDDAIGGSNPLLNGLTGGLAGLSIGANGTKSGSVGGGGSNNPSSSSVAATAAIGADGAAGSAINSDFGLLGLLSIIRMTDSDRNALALGDDLAALGLDMKSKDKLTDTFGGPFTDKPASSEPNYHIPMCYYMNPPALKTGHLSKFTLEILFYIFYAMPKDVLQAYSAQELYSREWRYHVDLKLWFKRAAPGDGVDLSDGSAKYIYFDFQTWDRRHFSGNVQQIVGGFLSEDDIRVKFPSSSS
mmetsp:Transcript_2395/g.4983  ORF Transcript_2395/g.4983 Transcript_2395/m.4983 type:complete len:418 (-) Transcript_2395:1309-2562(-)